MKNSILKIMIVSVSMIFMWACATPDEAQQDEGVNSDQASQEALTTEEVAEIDPALVNPAVLGERSTARNTVRTETIDGAVDDIVFLHGFGLYFNNGSAVGELAQTAYWGYWHTNFNDEGVGARKHNVYWDSMLRMEQLAAITAQAIVDNCQSSKCVVITHSTGGMVIDYILSRHLTHGGVYAQVYDKVMGVIEVASATGGVNLAKVAITDVVCAGGTLSGTLELAFNSIFGFLKNSNPNCSNPASFGAGYDLIPNVARSITNQSYIDTPALMIAGTGELGSDLLGASVKPYLIGTSDGLVAMHSGCGFASIYNNGSNTNISGSFSYQSGFWCSNKTGSYNINYANNSNVTSDFWGWCGSNDELDKKGNAISSKMYQDCSNPGTKFEDHYPFIKTGEGHGSELWPGLLNINPAESEWAYSNQLGSSVDTNWSSLYHLSTIVADAFTW
ncbi:hypothetical protein WDW89_04075 [Deltaproteobacteria bacterium TL4]